MYVKNLQEMEGLILQRRVGNSEKGKLKSKGKRCGLDSIVQGVHRTANISSDAEPHILNKTRLESSSKGCAFGREKNTMDLSGCDSEGTVAPFWRSRTML
jgi:hypothetical protein